MDDEELRRAVIQFAEQLGAFEDDWKDALIASPQFVNAYRRDLQGEARALAPALRGRGIQDAVVQALIRDPASVVMVSKAAGDLIDAVAAVLPPRERHDLVAEAKELAVELRDLRRDVEGQFQARPERTFSVEDAQRAGRDYHKIFKARVLMLRAEAAAYGVRDEEVELHGPRLMGGHQLDFLAEGLDNLSVKLARA